MSFNDVLNMILPLLYALVFVALIWFIVELVVTIRRTRRAVDEVQKKIEPTLEHVEEITAQLKPVVSKADPLVERISLTVDAANLELMRLDQILEDVNEITDTVSSAASAVDAAASAPMELVSNVTSRVRNVFKPRQASQESVELGNKKLSEVAQETFEAAQGVAQGAVKEVKEAVVEEREKNQQRKAERESVQEAKRQAAAVAHETSVSVNEAVMTTASVDVDAINEKYFTYSDGGTAVQQASEIPPQQKEAISDNSSQANGSQATWVNPPLESLSSQAAVQANSSTPQGNVQADTTATHINAQTATGTVVAPVTESLQQEQVRIADTEPEKAVVINVVSQKNEQEIDTESALDKLNSDKPIPWTMASAVAHANAHAENRDCTIQGSDQVSDASPNAQTVVSSVQTAQVSEPVQAQPVQVAQTAPTAQTIEYSEYIETISSHDGVGSVTEVISTQEEALGSEDNRSPWPSTIPLPDSNTDPQ